MATIERFRRTAQWRLQFYVFKLLKTHTKERQEQKRREEEEKAKAAAALQTPDSENQENIYDEKPNNNYIVIQGQRYIGSAITKSNN